MPDASSFEEELAELANRMLHATDTEHPVQQAMKEIDRRILLQWAENFRQQHKDYDDQWHSPKWSKFDQPPLPAHFEVSFGLDPVGWRDAHAPRADRPH
jgi:hypothetical protein